MTLDQFSLYTKRITMSKTERGKYLPLQTLDPKIILTHGHIDKAMVQKYVTGVNL